MDENRSERVVKLTAISKQVGIMMPGIGESPASFWAEPCATTLLVATCQQKIGIGTRTGGDYVGGDLLHFHASFPPGRSSRR